MLIQLRWRNCNQSNIVSIFLFILFSLCTSNLHAQQWELVWADEFTNGISSDWVYDIGNGQGGWGNNELQYYRAENASVSNGNLVITAKQESYGGFNYTSAKLKTQGKRTFKYGRIEARISAPSSMGLWPAFWMLGSNITSVSWPACGEIDLFEHVNTDAYVHGTMHWLDHNNTYANYGGSTAADVTTYHVYAIEWNSSEIRWYIDGSQYHVASISGGINGTHEFHNDFFLILNLAVGGNWPGFNIDNTKLPAKMLVDYVRVYRDASGTSTSSVTASSSSKSSASSTSGSLYGHSIVSSSSVKFFVNNASWADVHYTINNGTQQNIRMTHNADNSNTWTVSNIPSGATVKYYFTIGQSSGATDTSWSQFTMSTSTTSSSKNSQTSSAASSKKGKK